ncbi:MAG: hypothetical protein ISF22_10605 [Methanomassiliicoccus sp.]|nr:hypothetical protein [Methanomassiliicoccus sp.]
MPGSSAKNGDSAGRPRPTDLDFVNEFHPLILVGRVNRNGKEVLAQTASELYGSGDVDYCFLVNTTAAVILPLLKRIEVRGIRHEIGEVPL